MILRNKQHAPIPMNMICVEPECDSHFRIRVLNAEKMHVRLSSPIKLERIFHGISRSLVVLEIIFEDIFIMFCNVSSNVPQIDRK